MNQFIALGRSRNQDTVNTDSIGPRFGNFDGVLSLGQVDCFSAKLTSQLELLFIEIDSQNLAAMSS